MSALSVDGLTRRFGDLVAVNGLTFDVPTGGVVGFAGVPRPRHRRLTAALPRRPRVAWFG